jgi:hemerythrin-like domain-containing protein
MPNERKSDPTTELSATHNMRKQHQQILLSCKQIETLLAPVLPLETASNIAQLLAGLSGLIKVHLAMEDNVMYPALVNHADQMVANLAGQYKDEMGSLAATYLSYAAKWNAQSIASDPTSFSAASSVVFSALRERIDREDNELYVIVDKLGL